MSARAFRNASTASNTIYPRLFGHNGAIATHHYLSADAGATILKQGGNAVDAVAAAVFVEGLVNPHMYTLGGECPMLIRMANEGQVHSINGNTVAPAAATPEAYRARGLTGVPAEGVLAAGVPAAFGAILAALDRFGRLPLADVLAPAAQLARDGFPVHRGLLHQEGYGLTDLARKFLLNWPSSAGLYLPGGVTPILGARMRNPALANLFEHLSSVSAGKGRAPGIAAARDAFYRGDVAAAIVRFVESRDGLIARDDLAAFSAPVERPTAYSLGPHTLYKCGFWNQGPVVLQTLSILENCDLERQEHNSAAYVHLVVEAMKLAFADREQYYGDPLQVDIPQDALLSKAYGGLRAKLIDRGRADRMVRPGDPRKMSAELDPALWLGGGSWGPGTVHVNAIDGEGNIVAATPSGAWIRSSEVIPELGFPLGNRLMTFYLEPAWHPNLVAPHKRPRTTISPSLAEREGKPWMAFGSMGGDQQDQWMLQFFLNRACYGMTVQEAIEAPKFSSEHFPGFFAPHDRFSRRLRIEPAIGPEVITALAALGHDVEVSPDWSEGFLLASSIDPGNGVLEAGVDPRCAKTDTFPACARCW